MTEAGRILAVTVAMGLDPYLSLALLCGAALSGWSDSLPGDLVYLASLPILAVALALFAVEAFLERRATPGTVWCALQLPVRPVAAGLAALFFLPPSLPWTTASVVLGAATLGILIQALRCGGRVFLHACASRRPSPTLVGLAEDAVTAGLIVLALDFPVAGGGAAIVFLVAAIPLRGWLTATPFVIRLVRSALFEALAEHRWRPPEQFPGWLKERADDELRPPDSPLRGVPAALCAPTGRGALRAGWLVITASGPRFLAHRRVPPVRLTELTDLQLHPLWVTLAISGSEGDATLLIPRGGPTVTSLRAEMEG